jgi:hypothetical protein
MVLSWGAGFLDPATFRRVKTSQSVPSEALMASIARRCAKSKIKQGGWLSFIKNDQPIDGH